MPEAGLNGEYVGFSWNLGFSNEQWVIDSYPSLPDGVLVLRISGTKLNKLAMLEINKRLKEIAQSTGEPIGVFIDVRELNVNYVMELMTVVKFLAQEAREGGNLDVYTDKQHFIRPWYVFAADKHIKWLLDSAITNIFKKANPDDRQGGIARAYFEGTGEGEYTLEGLISDMNTYIMNARIKAASRSNNLES